MACPYCTWENLAPVPTTWEQFAYLESESRWMTWEEIFQVTSRSSCTTVKRESCSSDTNGTSVVTVHSYYRSSGLDTLRLYEDGQEANLTSLAWILLRLDDGTELYSYDYPDIFYWSTNSEEKGYIFLRLGLIDLGTRVYAADLIIKDLTFEDPLYWAKIRIISESRCTDG